jgi:hypothetical protein
VVTKEETMEVSYEKGNPIYSGPVFYHVKRRLHGCNSMEVIEPEALREATASYLAVSLMYHSSKKAGKDGVML